LNKVIGLLIIIVVVSLGLPLKFPTVEYLFRDLAGQEKREIFALAMAKADDQQVKTKKEFQDALGALRETIGSRSDVESTKPGESQNPKSEVALYYDKVSSEYKQSKAAVDDLRSRINELNSQAEALFTEWQKESTSFTANSEMQKRSLGDLRESKAKYVQVYEKLVSSLKKSEQTLTTFHTYVLAIKHRLNAQTIDDVGQEYSKLSSDISKLITEMDASIQSTQEYLDNK